MSNLNERVARFIARYRTVVAKSSVQVLNEVIAYDETHLYAGLGDEAEFCREVRRSSGIVETANNEEARYQELVRENILAELKEIQGVKSVRVKPSNINHAESLQVKIQAYYFYQGIFYDAGKWLFTVDMLSEEDNGFDIESYWYEYYALDDGTCFKTSTNLVSGHSCCTFGDRGTIHPLYGNVGCGFCFGDSYSQITTYLKTGDFVSAFQLVSLCLHHVNFCDTYRIPNAFSIAHDVDVRELADYFGLSDAEVMQVEARHQALRRQLETEIHEP